MKSIKASNLYAEVLHEINYPFADIFIFENFVISEIAEGVVFSWEDHGQYICEDVAKFVGESNNVIYISNRINSYTVVPTDWLKFYKYSSYAIKAYYIVGNSRQSIINSAIESLFFNSRIKRFNSIEAAANYAQHASLVLQEI